MVVAVEVVVEVVPVELPLAAVPDEIRNVAVPVVVHQNCTAHHLFHHPLNTLWVVSNSAYI